jgi:hypothetical protein
MKQILSRVYVGLLCLMFMALSACRLEAGSFTDYFEQKIVGHMLAGEAFTPPSTYYAALFTASPGETGGGTEATGGSYARVSFAFTRTNSSVGNTGVIEFPVSTSDHGTITAVAYFDASTAGNMIAYHVLTGATKTYNIGQTLRLPIGNLTSSVD